MAIRLLTTAQDFAGYDAWLKAHPQGTLWQSLERQEYLHALGKETRIYVAEEQGIVASAMVVIDRTSFGLSVWDIPRGPIWATHGIRGEWAVEALLRQVVEDAKKEACISLYLSPVLPLITDVFPFTVSRRRIHAEATRIVDLTQPDEEILAQMKQKGRYNLRLAEKNGVQVMQSDDSEAFYALVKKTGSRDGFTALPKTQYASFLRQVPGSFLLLAYDAQKTPVAGLIGVVWHGRGIYYYGASQYASRALMAPYMLQWEAMHFCRKHGCAKYDLLGIAPEGAGDDHPWAGITRFKEQFGGKVETYPPERELVLRPWRKRLLGWKRKFFR
jgi:lipid II:glycine glycyltransferase (peptidoglycan interpeptide bridge formation enzyme)